MTEPTPSEIDNSEVELEELSESIEVAALPVSRGLGGGQFRGAGALGRAQVDRGERGAGRGWRRPEGSGGTGRGGLSWSEGR